MLKSRPVVLDFEGFRHKKSGFIIKKLAVSTENYCDTVSFLPPLHSTYCLRVRDDHTVGCQNISMV